MATIFIHIGAPKTATSTLQSVLANNYSKLLKQGVLYPKSGRHGSAHHVLVCDLIEKYQGNMPDIWYGDLARGEAWEALKNEISEHEADIESVILSSELFFGQNKGIEQMLDEVSEHLHGHEVRVVVYLRRQDQMYSSFYNQDVKGVRQWPASAYEFYQTHQLFRYHYHTLMDVWSGAFGKKHIIIRPFESDQWLNGDIVQDFCAATETPLLVSGYKDHNESLGECQLYLKRCLNRVGFNKSENDNVLTILVKTCPEEPLKGSSYVNKGLYSRLRAQWLQANEAISRDYLGGEPLFRKDIPEPDEIDLYNVNKVRLAAQVKRLYEAFDKGKHRDYRPLFARALLLATVEKDNWLALTRDEYSNVLSWVE